MGKHTQRVVADSRPATLRERDPQAESSTENQILKSESPSGQLLPLAAMTVTGPPTKAETHRDRTPAFSPALSVLEIARSFGTQTDPDRRPMNTWRTVFDHREIELVSFWLNNLNYEIQDAESDRRMEEASRGKNRIRYTRHVTVRSACPAQYATRSLETKEDWKFITELALDWYRNEKRVGVEVHVMIESGSVPKPESLPMIYKERGWTNLKPAYDGAVPTSEDLRSPQKRARKSSAR